MCLWGLRAWRLSFPPVRWAGSCLTSCGLTHPVVLICRHGRELGLREDEGLEVLLRVALAVFAWVHEDHVEAQLVAVHRAENDLQGVRKGWDSSKPSLGPKPFFQGPLPPSDSGGARSELESLQFCIKGPFVGGSRLLGVSHSHAPAVSELSGI